MNNYLVTARLNNQDLSATIEARNPGAALARFARDNGDLELSIYAVERGDDFISYNDGTLVADVERYC